MSHILIVEDDPTTAEMMTRLLIHAGYTVRHFDRGLAGIRDVRANAPALILMDFNLPDVDGRTLVLSLKKIMPGGSPIPVVAVTARSGPHEQALAQRFGCEGFIAKPFAPEDLLKMVQQFLPQEAT
jgi:CheY-like chemotaxis protein